MPEIDYLNGYLSVFGIGEHHECSSMPMTTTQAAQITLTTDIVVLRPGLHDFEILLIKRGRPPFVGTYALPGGKVNSDESAEQAAQRELLEETGLSATHLDQVATFSDPGRDPRGRFVSVAFLCVFGDPETNVQAGDDATEAKWFPINALPELAFDHRTIISRVLVSRMAILEA